MTKILLVDDEDLVRKVLRVVLEAEAFHVLEASSVEEALKVALADRPAVVVCDLMLPDAAGADLVRALKRAGSDAKVLVLTSMPISDATATAEAAGADAVMVKPFSALGLMTRIREMAGLE